MNKLKYFAQFILIVLFFLIFKILGLKLASFISGKFFQLIGPILDQKINSLKY